MRPIQVVLGLGFGDEGKGATVDWLARQAPTPPLVVRWNGGPQAMHHVVTDDLQRALTQQAVALLDRVADPPEAARALAARAGARDLRAAFLDAAHGLLLARAVITPVAPTADDVIFEGAHGALLDQDHGF